MNFLQTLDENLKKTLTPPIQSSNLVETIAQKIGADKAPVPKITPSKPVIMSKPKAPDVAGMVVNVIRTPFQAIAQGLHDTIGAVTNQPPSAFQAQDPIGKFILGSKPLKTGQDYINEFTNQIVESKKAGTPSWQYIPLAIMGTIGTGAAEASGLFGGEANTAKILFKKSFDDLVKFGTYTIKDAETATNVLKNVGVSEDIAKNYGPKLALSNTEASTKKILEDAAKEQIKLNEKVNKISPKIEVYHGGEKIDKIDLDKSKFAKTFFVSDNAEYARQYAGKTGIVNKLNLDPNAKLIDIKNATPEEISAIRNKIKEIQDTHIPYSGEGGFNQTFGNTIDELLDGAIRGKSHFAEDPALIDVYKKLGYDGMVSYEDVGMRGKNIGIWNKNVLETTSEITGKERSYITSAKASERVAEEIKTELQGVYDVKTNKELVSRSNARVSDNIDDAKTLATTEATDEAIATGVSLTEHYSNEIFNTASQTEKIKIAKEAADIINKQAKVLTEAGRTIQAASLIGKTTPEGMLRTIARTIQDYNKTARIKLPELSAETIVEVLEKGKKIESMADGLSKQVAIKELTEKLESLIPSPWWKKVTNVWKAGLLTGLKTSGVNIQSNFWNGVAEQVKNIPATGFDLATSLVTGERTKALNLRGLFQGNKEGIKKGWDYLKTGISEEKATSALEFSKVHFDSKPGKILETYADTVYRVLGAEDMPFFYGALRRSLGEQALVTIKNEGKVFSNSTEKAKFIQDFIDNPPKDALALADLDAKMATFKNDTALGHMAQAIQNSPILGPAAQMTILPFAKTPSAVAMQLFNYSPTGIISTFYKTFKDGKFNQKEFVEGLGRVVTGTGALWIGSQLYQDGLISLGYPTDEKERAKWEATGKLPNSVKIGESWFPLIQLGPVGGIMGIGGYFEKGKQETGSLAGGIANGFFGGVKGLTEQTFLTGVKGLVDVINDPEKKWEDFVARPIGSIVPTIISDTASAMDEYQRKSTGSVLGALKSRIPILREELPKKLDVWGQPLERNRSAIATAISPIRLSNTIQGILNTEVERLSQFGEDIRPTKVDKYIGNVKLDDSEYYKYQRFYGNILVRSLTALVKNKEYQSLDPEQQAKEWKKNVSGIRKEVNSMILPELMKRRYNLDETINPVAFTQYVDHYYKTEPKFSKASSDKQKKFILKIMQK